MCVRHISPIKTAVYWAGVGCNHLPIWRNWPLEPVSTDDEGVDHYIYYMNPSEGSLERFISGLRVRILWVIWELVCSYYTICGSSVQWISLFTRTAGKLTAKLVAHLKNWWHSFYELASFLDPVYIFPWISLCFAFFFPTYFQFTLSTLWLSLPLILCKVGGKEVNNLTFTASS